MSVLNSVTWLYFEPGAVKKGPIGRPLRGILVQFEVGEGIGEWVGGNDEIRGETGGEAGDEAIGEVGDEVRGEARGEAVGEVEGVRVQQLHTRTLLIRPSLDTRKMKPFLYSTCIGEIIFMFGILCASPPPPAKPTNNMLLFKSEDSTGTIVFPFLLSQSLSKSSPLPIVRV